MKKSISLLMVLFMMAVPAQAKIDSTGVQEAQAVKGGRYFKRVLDDIKISGKKKSLRGASKVAVPFFKLNFITDGKYTNRVGGLTTSTSKVKSELSGVDEATFQQITNEVYDDFLNVLRSKGYQVLPTQALENNERYAGMDRDYPDINRKVAEVTPYGMPFPSTFGDRSMFLATELDAVVLKVELDVNFVIINRNEKKFTLGNKAAVSISQGMNTAGQVTAYTPKDMVTLTIQQPVTSPRPFGMVNNETSAGDKASDAIVAVAGILNGAGLGGKRQSTKSVDVEADPQAYRIAAGDTIVKINRMIADAFQSLTEGGGDDD